MDPTSLLACAGTFLLFLDRAGAFKLIVRFFKQDKVDSKEERLSDLETKLAVIEERLTNEKEHRIDDVRDLERLEDKVDEVLSCLLK